MEIKKTVQNLFSALILALSLTAGGSAEGTLLWHNLEDSLSDESEQGAKDEDQAEHKSGMADMALVKSYQPSNDSMGSWFLLWLVDELSWKSDLHKW